MTASEDVVDAVILYTPTAFLVTDAEPETDEWFAARREGITATDIPKILGLTKYGNALSVFLDKRGELDDEAGEEAFWGHQLEDPVAQRWADLNGTTVTRVGVLANDERRWQRASLDRLVDTCPDGDGDCGLEVKTRSAWVEGRYRDGIPDDVLAQVLWQRLVTGLHHIHTAVLIGGQRMRAFRVDADPDIEKYLIEQAEPVWTAVLYGFPPDVEPDSEGILLDLLNRVYTERAGDRDLDPVVAESWLTQYAAGHDLETEGKRLKTQAKTGLVKMLDDGDTGLVDGAVTFTYKRPTPGLQMTAPAIRKLQVMLPGVFKALTENGLVTTTEPGPRFNLTKQKADTT